MGMGDILMQGAKPIDTLRVLTGEEAIDAYKVLSDESRRQILHALRARRMSTSELVEFLSEKDPKKAVKPQTVRYHIKELVKCGLVEQDGYEPTGDNGDSHIMKKIWRATAENVFIATGDMDGLPEHEELDLNKTLDIVGTMRALDLQLKDEQETMTVAEDLTKRDRIYLKGLEMAKETLRQVPEIDPKLYVMFRRILSVVRLNEAEYEDYWELSRKITDILREAFKRGRGKNPEVY
jgi:DNA-binding transcriptional ArsR family regulator